MANWKEELQNDLDKVNADVALMEAGMKKKWQRTIIRWVLTVAIYVYFWDVEWVRKSLWIVAPLMIINLLSMLFLPRLLKMKMAQTQEAVKKAQSAGATDNNADDN